MPSNAEIANQLSELINSWQTYINQQRELANGTADGGPNGDGYYPITDPAGITVMTPSVARIASDANQPKFINVKMTSGSTYTLDVNTHKGAIINLEGPAPDSAITVRLPTNAPPGWACTIIQNNTGKMTFSATGSNSFYNRQGYTKTAGQGSPMTALSKSRNSQGLTNWVYFGDMSS